MALATVDYCRPRLAQELLDFVLDHLHYDSKTLKQCALASKCLLPACQLHLFSSYEISSSNVYALMKLFTPHKFTDGRDDEGATLRAAVANLLNTHATDLTLAISRDEFQDAFESSHLPEFKNVRNIVFKGEQLQSCLDIPSFLERTWTSPNSGIKSVGFNFELTSGKGVLESLCILPATVENVSLTFDEFENDPQLSATSIRSKINLRHGDLDLDRGVHRFGGALRLQLAPYISHKEFLEAMLELEDLFKFEPKSIKYRVTSIVDTPFLASLVGECKATLQYLDILCIDIGSIKPMEFQPFDFSQHRALRSIRIWTSADCVSGWLSSTLSSIPKPSNGTPRDPPLRIELHISLPLWAESRGNRRSRSKEVHEMVVSCMSVDVELSRLIGLSTEAPSAPGGTFSGITVDVSVTNLIQSYDEGIAAFMFPLMSGEGVLRLV